jgi:hypothetical protein
MNAHRLVIIAAALTIVVAAALASVLATFSGQAELGDITAHATLVSGRWPGRPASGQPIPAALHGAVAVCAVALPHLVGLVCRPVRLLPGPAPRSSSHLMLSSSACPPPRSSSWPWPRCSRRLRCCADAALPACSGQTKR